MIRSTVLSIAVVAASALVGLDSVAATDVPVTSCRVIVHRAYTATHDEETAEAIAELGAAGHWVELDTRLTAERHQVLVHDPSLGRITTPHNTTPMIDQTLAQIQAVTLNRGGHVLSTLEGIRAIKAAGTSGLIEFKQWATYRSRWRAEGFPDLHDWIVGNGMVNRIWVGGQTTATGDDIADFHARYPDIRIFWRTKPTDTVTVAEAQARGATLVELDKSHLTPEVVAPLKAAGIITGTRTLTSQEMFQTAYNAGIRRYQTNHAYLVVRWCGSQPG